MTTALRRVVLDARWIFSELSGIGLYTRQLMRHLPAAAPDVEFVFVFDRPELQWREWAEWPGGPPSNARSELVPWPPYAPHGHLWAARWVGRFHAQVFHSPNYLLPGWRLGWPRSVRAVVTVHDLIPLRFPHFTPRARKTRWIALFRRLMTWSVGRADAVIVPSRCTADDVGAVFGPAVAARTTVIPEAADPALVAANISASRAGRPTVLFVGRRDPYKNLLTLLDAVARLRTWLPNIRLVVVGAPDPRYPDAEQRAQALGLRDVVEWRGYVPAEQMCEVYREAWVLAMPSRYEGFGLPVLEAMACGVPVVCARAGSLPEVVCRAALVVEPDDVAGWADALGRVLTDPTLAEDLAQRGHRRAAEFSWDRTARETVEVYRHVLV